MEFCENCGSIMKIVKRKEGSIFYCNKCSHFRKGDSKEMTFVQKDFEKNSLGKGVAKEAGLDVGWDFNCKKCGNNKCIVFDLGMMYGDEDWVYLLKCTRCDYSERVGEVG